jgi:II/X family phage/plasmid replication protein
MWDKIDLRIPFHDLHVQEYNSSTVDARAGRVNFLLYDYKGSSSIVFTDGIFSYEDPKICTWDSIPTSISSTAIGFYPEGNGFDPWPHIRLKGSPAKILQGHNVFGSEDPREGVYQMLANLRLAFPKIYQHLDIQEAEIHITDSTYSGRFESLFYRDKFLELLEKTADSRRRLSRHEGYLLIGAGSSRKSQKVYLKDTELLADAAKAKREGNRQKYEILSDKRLQDFALNLMRFEATTKKLEFQRLGIPTKLTEFLKFNDWYQRVYKEPMCRYLWRNSFDSMFKQLEGHTMKNVDDEVIKTKIYAKLTKIKDNGKVCRRLPNAVWKTYKNIKSFGFDSTRKDGGSTFYRHKDLLIDEIGLSELFLKSLDPNDSTSNVVPIITKIDIDFSRQRPDWYEEPVCGYDDKRRHLRLVG